jgi:photosystem II stability/assembly factor-like uncharacterized protein
MVMHPTDSNVILAATSNGVYKTTDAGANWYQTLSGNLRDIEINPANPSVIYTSGASYYRSDDGGESFTQISDGIPSSDSRMAIGVSADQPDYVYVLVGNNSAGFTGMYRSTDAGLTFTEQSNSPNLLGWSTDGSDSGGQAWYDLSITVDPSDADIVYTGGVNVYKSIDGGVSWSLNGHWYGGGGAPYVHADVHALEFINGELYVGCDGGIFHTDDGGSSYSDKSSNLEIAQIYRLGTSETQNNLVMTGWQDNGTNLKNGTNWSRVIGGDGMECLISHADASEKYGELYYGNIRRSTGGGYSTWVSSNGTGVNSSGNWVTPFIQDPVNADVFYVGKDSLYKTTDGGATWDGLFEPTGSNIDEIAACESNPDYVYCSVDNDIFLTTDGGATFNEITNGLPNRYITYIAVSDTDENKVWVTFSGFSSADKVWKSEDAGGTWTNVSAGLPNVPVNTIVYEKGSNDAVYCGTDVGVFFRNDTYSTWQSFGNGMPSIVISELEINYLSSSLVAATYGRGLWKSDLFSTLNLDAGIAQIIYPIGTECSSEIEGQVLLQNFGNANLTAVDINYAFDNNPTSAVGWTGNLAVGQSEVVLLPLEEDLGGGAHTLDVYTSSPNGGSDEFNPNDSKNQEFSLADQELMVQIITDRWGSETTWEVYDENDEKVAGGGPYVTEQVNGEYPQADEIICIPAGCFDFIIYDSYGDGMCCGYGNGSFAVSTLAGDTLLSGGSGWDDSDTLAYCPVQCPGDSDADMDVDIDDFLAFNSAYGSSCSGCPQDMDGNGLINIDDFLAFNSSYGTNCLAQVSENEELLAPELVHDLRNVNQAILHPELAREIDKMTNPFGLSLYPNPNNGQEVFLSFQDVDEESVISIELYNALGEQLLIEKISSTSPEMTHRLSIDESLSKGIYMVHILIGDVSVSKPMVVE